MEYTVLEALDLPVPFFFFFTFVSHTNQYCPDSTAGLRVWILFLRQCLALHAALGWPRIQYVYQAAFEHLLSLLPLPLEHSEACGIVRDLALDFENI